MNILYGYMNIMVYGYWVVYICDSPTNKQIQRLSLI